MFPPQSERSKELCRRVAEFMEAHVYPAEGVYKRQVDEAKDRWDAPPVMAELKAKAEPGTPKAEPASTSIAAEDLLQPGHVVKGN